MVILSSGLLGLLGEAKRFVGASGVHVVRGGFRASCGLCKWPSLVSVLFML